MQQTFSTSRISNRMRILETVKKTDVDDKTTCINNYLLLDGGGGDLVLKKESSDKKENDLERVVTEKSGDISQNKDDFGKSNIPNTSEKCIVDTQSSPAQISTRSGRAIVKLDRLTF